MHTAPGRLTLAKHTIRDVHPANALSVGQVLARSSNVGAAKIALALPREGMWDFLRRVGFGTAPELGFPGAAGGKLRHFKSWRPIEQATMGYGHGIGEPRAARPRIHRIRPRRGMVPLTLVKTGAVASGEKVLSAEAARAVRAMLEDAVQPGATGPRARIMGWRVAGKTGTAHKQENGGYAADKYLSSFVGLAPVSAPRLVVAVMIDEPSAGEHYGGAVAAPVFAQVMQGALRLLGVPHDAPLVAPDRGRCGEGKHEMDYVGQLAAQGAMIEHLSTDSRRCAPGVAFLAYPGERADGRAHIADALGRGASGVLWEERDFRWRPEWRLPNVPVRELKQQAGRLAHDFYGRPTESLWVCGVTGTNGKTSCSQWIAAALGKTAVVGTLGAGFPGALSVALNTTPDAVELQRLLLMNRRCRRRRGRHGGVLARAGARQVNAVRFSCALFTNLTHDHLDYHGTMEDYAEAKARLFTIPGSAPRC